MLYDFIISSNLTAYHNNAQRILYRHKGFALIISLVETITFMRAPVNCYYYVIIPNCLNNSEEERIGAFRQSKYPYIKIWRIPSLFTRKLTQLIRILPLLTFLHASLLIKNSTSWDIIILARGVILFRT